MKKVVTILQLTDQHLFGNIDNKLVGVKPYYSYIKIIEQAKTDATNRPDLIVLTGDLSQDRSLASYELIKNSLNGFNCPIYATMGNHDNPKYFAQTFGSANHIFTVTAGTTNWCILLLNSHLPSHVDGRLAQTELDFLNMQLDLYPNEPIIIFIHHHLLPVNSAWLDKIKLQNSEQFLAIISDYKNIKAVVCGHIHQKFEAMYNDTLFLATPSTSWQFATNSKNFKLDNLMPGYRWIKLHEDGKITSKVVRVEHDDDFIPDQNSKGY